jgi:hypothetical protein
MLDRGYPAGGNRCYPWHDVLAEMLLEGAP